MFVNIEKYEQGLGITGRDSNEREEGINRMKLYSIKNEVYLISLKSKIILVLI